MEIIVTDLVRHEYSDREFNNSSPNCLKEDEFEWNNETNKTHPLCDDISKYHIAISYQNIDTNDSYAYFFINEEINDLGCFTYFLEKIYLDKRLSNRNIRKIINRTLTVLVNEDYQEDNLICAYDVYRFHMPLITRTKAAITKCIIEQVHKHKGRRIFDFIHYTDEIGYNRKFYSYVPIHTPDQNYVTYMKYHKPIYEEGKELTIDPSSDDMCNKVYVYIREKNQRRQAAFSYNGPVNISTHEERGYRYDLVLNISQITSNLETEWDFIKPRIPKA